MDIQILDSWLKDHVKTQASPQKIAEALSLSGPSVERVHPKGKKDATYDIEVTTNRVDSASHYGIAREAAAILPRFKIKASLQPLKAHSVQRIAHSVSWLDAKVDPKLCPRFTTILIRDVKIGDSPKWLQERLEAVGLRAINNIVDISNYLMLDLGQPVHTFDYDKIFGAKMIVRLAKNGETITTLDDKTHALENQDMIIEDGEGRVIDLCGTMGGKNSAVDENTKNVLLFVQTFDPVRIRKTSMRLAHRTDAAQLFEKGLDPEQVEITIRRGIDLFEELCDGKPESEILDLYPKPYQIKKTSLTLPFINKRLGVELTYKQVTESLEPLGFETAWKHDELIVSVPSWRAQDVDIPEDIVEEVARIYGYHNLPSTLMPGIIPDPLPNAPFEFETKVKNILKGWGGVEVYTLSLVAKNKVDITGESSWVLKLKNPLGSDSEYLRLSLAPSLKDAAMVNSQEKEPFYLFEVANVYLPVRGELPEEKMTLGGIFAHFDWEKAKGIAEGLLDQLGIDYSIKAEDARGFEGLYHVTIISGKETIGQFGKLDSTNLLYLEFDMQALQKVARPLSSFKPLPKYPAQIEDLSLTWPSKTLVSDIINLIQQSDPLIVSVDLIDSYESSKAFRIAYQSPDKTLTDQEVEAVRKKVLEKLNKKFGVKLKE